jgi:hypothetical protein
LHYAADPAAVSDSMARTNAAVVNVLFCVNCPRFNVSVSGRLELYGRHLTRST